MNDEIPFFNALAAEWWNPSGPQAMLHKVNPLRLRWIAQHGSLKGKKVLDVGCGAGLLSEGLANMGAEVTGIDLGEDLIRVAQDHAKAAGLEIDYICQPLASFGEEAAEVQIASYAGRRPSMSEQAAFQALPRQNFDAICCLEMLEHVDDFDAIIKEIAKRVKPNGYVFLSTIDRSPKAFLQVILAAEYLLKMIPRGTHHYAKLIRPEELTASLRKYGLTPISLSGLKYQPLLKTFSLSPKPKPNYWIVAQKD